MESVTTLAPSCSRRVICFSLLCAIGSLLISFLAAEFILRIMGYGGAPQTMVTNVYPVDDPILDWRTLPNSEYKEGGVLYKYNSSGFRDVEHAVVKPSGVTRIVVLVDSVSEGLGFEAKDTFSYVLQSELGDKFEVINIVARALNTPQEIHLFEKEGLKYKSDLVILNFVLNDSDFYSSLENARRAEAENESKMFLFGISINPKLKRLLKSSAAVYFVHQRVHELKSKLMGMDEQDYYTDLWKKQENRLKVINAFDKLALLRKQDRFEVMIIIWPLITDYEHYGLAFVHNWLTKEAETRGFMSVDLLPIFSKFPWEDLRLTTDDNIHPNGLGHKLAVASFLSWYRSLK